MRLVGARTARLLAGALGAAAGAAAAGLRRLAGPERSEPHEATAYRLLEDERVSAGIRRIVLARVDDALAHLEGAGGETRDDAIHEARKDLKKTRSAIRLVREGLGDEIYRRENAHYREVGRTLSGFRDAEALIESLDALCERFAAEAEGRFAGLRGGLSDELRASREGGSRERAMTEAAAALRVGRERVRFWSFGAEGWELIEPGLRRSYRRGRKRLADAEREPTVHNLHEWRKRVKDLWYQLRLISGGDAEIDRLVRDADDLADRLGDDHDLALLREAAAERAERFGSAADQRLLGDLIDRRRDELRFAAMTLGERLYAEKPKAFTAKLGRRWGARRGG